MARQIVWFSCALACSACDEVGSTVGPTDTEVPLAGEAITFSDIAAASLTVRWGAAEDDWTNARGLQYKLVRAADASEIDSLSELAAITNGPGLVQDYARGVTSKAILGLKSGTTYAFAVAVRDNTGNEALYAPAIVTTLDSSAPLPGASIGFSDIAATSLTVSWGAASDDVTPASQLLYKLVMAPAASRIDTLAEAAAITGAAGLVQDFTAGLTSKAVTGLSSSTAYAFAVIVRDGKGNEALYAPAMVATPDVTPPSLGTPITFSNIAAHGLSVNWGPATDAVTGLAGIKYKVVKARDAAAIDTLEEVDAISSGERLVMDFVAGVASAAVTGLTSSTSYAFAVVVKDAAGNRALYAPATAVTLDVSAPAVGAAIEVSNVSATGLSLSWGAATDELTAQGALQYKVVKAASAAAIDTLEEIALITNGSNLLQDFSAGLVSKTVTGLTSSTSYAFAVLVKDQQGNQAIYAPVTQSTLDDTPPLPGAALSVGNVSALGLTLSWGKATDNVTGQAALQYKVVQAVSSSSIDTLSEVDAITSGPGLVMDFSADVATRDVTGLSSSSSYAFAVVVRDAAGNRALYAPAVSSTLDVSAPIAGTALSFSSVTDSSLSVDWGAASDDVTSAAALQYKLVRAAQVSDIDSLSEVDAITSGADLLQDFSANVTAFLVTGLTSSSTYAFAVVVRDSAGNEALYAPTSQTTLDVTAPTLGASISFSDLGPTSVTVDWGAASDELSPPEFLEYKLVWALDPSEIDTLAEITALSSGIGVVQPFTPGLTSFMVTGLSPSTSYAFAVVVCDAAGNETLYAPAIIITTPS